MSFSHRPERGNWLLSQQEMKQVEADILKSGIRIDRSHDVPYVAGYSKDGRTIYIDHQMPKGFAYKGRFVPTDIYIILHEGVEKSLESGVNGRTLVLKYLPSHQVALRTERDAVMANGVPWGPYNAFCMHWIKIIGSRPLYPNCPRDLDLEPYYDENDRATLRRMRFGGTNAGSQPETAQLVRNGQAQPR